MGNGKKSPTDLTSTLHFTFGEIIVNVGVEGNIDRAEPLVNHLMTTATNTLNAETIWRGVTDGDRSESTEEHCKTLTEIGDMKIYAEINIKADRRIRKHKLCTILYTVAARLNETAEMYNGEHQILTTPAAPIQARPVREMQNSTSDSLGLQLPHENGHVTKSASEHGEHVFAGHQQ